MNFPLEFPYEYFSVFLQSAGDIQTFLHFLFQIILLPMFTFSAASAVKALIAFDTCGMIAGWQLLDHAAHLGGVLTGVW